MRWISTSVLHFFVFYMFFVLCFYEVSSRPSTSGMGRRPRIDRLQLQRDTGAICMPPVKSVIFHFSFFDWKPAKIEEIANYF